MVTTSHQMGPMLAEGNQLLKAEVGVMGVVLARFRIRATLTVDGEGTTNNKEMPNFKVSVLKSVWWWPDLA